MYQVEFSPVDRCVATCSGDRTVKLWSIADCLCLRTFQVTMLKKLHEPCFRLQAAAQRGVLSVVRTNRRKKEMPAPTPNPPNLVTYSIVADHTHIA